MSFFFILLALLGLSFLIFIHELGHYFMARHVGMRVETFSIGFGKPIAVWKRDGVKWQVGWLPFGGYVKIAGTESDGDTDPYTIADGFFGKSPLARIKVAFMGPFFNFLFAVVAFAAIWVAGGREKGFHEVTSLIGWVDTQSELYKEGIRPGDEISAYDEKPFHHINDHLYATLEDPEEIDVKGFKYNYILQKKTPFDIKIKPYNHPLLINSSLLTTGITSSARYLIYGRGPAGMENPLPENSPMVESGLTYGDRLLWVDGHLIFSDVDLSKLLNDERVLVTVKRGNQTFLARVPRVRAKELKIQGELKEELTDWQYASQLNRTKFNQLFVLPYSITSDCTIENPIKFIDQEDQEAAFPEVPFSKLEKALQAGDRIVAIDGTFVKQAPELLKELQQRNIHLIVQRDPEILKPISSKLATAQFEEEITYSHINAIAQTIGTEDPVTTSGTYHLLKPITPITRHSLLLPAERQARVAASIQEKRKAVEAIDDPKEKEYLLSVLEERENQLILGITNLQDRTVIYNPPPLELFYRVAEEIRVTLTGLIVGNISPKVVAGPVGIVHAVQQRGMMSLANALFWLGAISLNLGILNLLPIPMLDGGSIVFSLFEMASGRKLKPKTLEKLIFPFAVLIIIFFIFVTYNDLIRIFKGFLTW